MQLRLVILALAFGAVSSAGVTNVAGAAFTEPDDCTTLNCELRLGPVKAELPDASFTTRGFNGGLPGPTLRVKAGETLNVTLINLLQNVDNGDDIAMNEFRTPNTTNLHTHGLHVSSASPGDDIFYEVEPEHTGTYSFTVPSYHMGGTHWYHPHHHGATALQAGGGAAGLLIVEDADDEVPEEIANMPELEMFFSAIDLAKMVELQEEFNDQLWQVSGTGADDIVLLVNGQTEPVVSMDTGVWYRWRIIYAAVESTATVSFDDDSCEMQLLAKDGIYLQTMPRTVTELPLYPGARADVAVRCSTATTVNLVSAGRRRLQPGGGGDMGGTDAWEGTVLSVEVSGTDAAAADLTRVSINRPCYLADTQSGTVDYSESLDLAGGNEFTVNGDVYVSSTTYLDTFAAGSLVELDVSGIQGHPFHLHVNPYQVVAMDADDTTYFQVGDWHDTVYDGSDESTVRFYTDNFVGKMVVHCHVLEHEDQGMMGLYEISGTAGTTYADAETLDPTCYRGAGGRGYTVSDDDGAAASDDTVVTSSAARHGGPAAAALVALASSALVVALAMMN